MKRTYTKILKPTSCPNCDGIQGLIFKGITDEWKQHVGSLCLQHLYEYKDANSILYKRAMGLNGEPAWKNSYWASMYADRIEIIDQHLASIMKPGSVADPLPPRKKWKEEIVRISTKSGKGEGANLRCSESLDEEEDEEETLGESRGSSDGYADQTPEEALERFKNK